MLIFSIKNHVDYTYVFHRLMVTVSILIHFLAILILWIAYLCPLYLFLGLHLHEYQYFIPAQPPRINIPLFSLFLLNLKCLIVTKETKQARWLGSKIVAVIILKHSTITFINCVYSKQNCIVHSECLQGWQRHFLWVLF